ncbi:hypothetical protein [Nonomuraea sp. NPDC050310]|uniref:hypothetical protein n=1 Tax=Nonomuraea sp. NPDC050310 TaxID=3154935 RepID=UPI0033EA5644
MKRGGRLQRKTELKSKTGLKPGKPLARKARLRHRSKKQEAIYRERRPLVARLLAERPACERCDRARSVDVHEPGMRSRGADILDPDQCVCLCRPCHRWIHDHPALATAEGWLIPSGGAKCDQ